MAVLQHHAEAGGEPHHAVLGFVAIDSMSTLLARDKCPKLLADLDLHLPRSDRLLLLFVRLDFFVFASSTP